MSKIDSVKKGEKIEDNPNETVKKPGFAPLTDKEIADIANDLYRGMIFTDRHIQRPEDVASVFMPLIFMKENDIKKLKADPPGMIYEYFSEAMPRSINGMPMFMSCRMISIKDTKKVMDIYKRIKQAVESVNQATEDTNRTAEGLDKSI